MEIATTGVKIVSPDEVREGFLGSIGVRFLIDGHEAGDGFSLVEHPMAPRALAAPLHLHTREDEYSFVLEGRMGALLGDEVVEAGAGAAAGAAGGWAGGARATSSSSRATSGTPSGTQATSPAGSSRSSRPPA